MHILLFVLFLCVVVLLWAAFAVARHIRRHNVKLQSEKAVATAAVNANATNTDGIPSTVKVPQDK